MCPSKITVAISTFRKSYFNWVAELLKSLENQTLKCFDVIVVVSKDIDYGRKISEFVKSKMDTRRLNVNIVFNYVEKGIAHSRNLALRSAKGPYIAYTDDDAIPHSCWLEELLWTLESYRTVAAATGPVEVKFEGGIVGSTLQFPRELYWAIGCTSLDIPRLTPVRNGFGSNLALKRTVALRCGGFNNAFGYNQKRLIVGEEPELGIRLIRANYATLWNPKAIVYHRISRERLSTKNILMRSFIEGKTKAILTEAYGSDILKPEMGHLGSVVRSLVKSRSPRLRALLALSTMAVLGGFAVHRILRYDLESEPG